MRSITIFTIAVLSLLSLSTCKEHKQQLPKSTFPAFFVFEKAGFEKSVAGMVKSSNGVFAVQTVENASGFSFSTRVGLLDMENADAKNIVKVERVAFNTSFSPQTSIVYSKSSDAFISAATSPLTSIGDTITRLTLLSFDEMVTPKTSTNVNEPRFILSRLAVLNDGYLAVGAYNKNSQYDVCVVKFDKQLTRLWGKRFGGVANDMAMDAVQLCDGNIGVLAYTYSYGAGDRDIWFLKLNQQGDTIFTKTFGGSGYEEPQQILGQDGTCDYYIASHSASFGNPEHHGYLLCINQDGQLKWQNTYGTAEHDGFNAITYLPDGKGIIAAGRSMQAHGAPENIFVVVTDFNGKELWRKIYGDENLSEYPASIITDNNYYYLVCNRYDSQGKISSVLVVDELK